MRAVCEDSAGSTFDDRLQCDGCPSYTADYGQTAYRYQLWAIYVGHFSRKDSDELLVVLGGCEDAHSPMGAVLLTREGAAWKNSGYFEAGDPCLPVRAPDGFDRLICEVDDMHFGNYVGVLEARSFKNNAPYAEPLLHLSGNLGGGDAPGGRCYGQGITSLEKLPSGAGFTVTIKQTSGPLPEGVDSCADYDNGGPQQTIVLNFRFDGDDFVLAPESEADMKRLQ